MISVNSSYMDFVNQHNLAKNTKALNQAMERLATGCRINHESYDPSGLYKASSLSSQISSLEIANKNNLLAANFLEIANGSLTTVSDCLMRMKDLATQASSGILSDGARNALQSELDSLAEQVNRSISGSTMNGVKTLTADIKMGSSAEEEPAEAEAADAPNPVIRLQVGETTDESSAIQYNSAISLDLRDLDLSTVEGAQSAMAKLQAQLETVTAKQSYIGIQLNRLDDIYNAQQIRIENLSAARSTIMDTDYAKEVANMVKYQILQQISASILTQTRKMSGQIALSLLQ